MRALAIAMLVSGCVSSSSVVCEDGRVCPSGTECRESLCVPKTCGNGKLDPGEQCDGLDLGSLDCVDFDYYGPEGLTCSSTCSAETSTCTGGICGDGELDLQEACDIATPTDHCGDFGFDVGRATCANTCTDDVSGCDRIGWTQMSSGTTADLAGVWGTGANDMFAVGRGGTILRYDGAGWSPMASHTTADLRSVSGAGSSFVIAVGTSGTIVQWNGLDWSAMASGTTQNLNGVFVVSPTRAYATGASDTVLVFNGSSWSSLTIPGASGNEEFLAVWANATDVLVAGFTSDRQGAMVRHYAATGWTIAFTELGGGPMYALTGTATTDVWMTGPQGRTVHWKGVDDRTCSTITCVFVNPNGELFGIWEDTATNVFAVGTDGAIFHKTTPFTGWPAQDTVSTVDDLHAVYGPDPNSVFAVGSSGRIVRSTGIQRAPIAIPEVGANYAGGYAPSENTVYVAGQLGNGGVVYEFVGDNNNDVWLKHFIGGEPLNAVWWAPPSGPILAVGTHGVIESNEMGPWSAVHSDPTMTLNGIWGTTYSDVFTVGAGTSGGVILHFNGDTWTEQTVPPGVGTLFSVWGTSPSNVYAVGDAGVILHYDGAGWTNVRPAGASATPLFAVWTGGDEVIAVGAEIVQRHGMTWIATRAPATLRALSGTPRNVYASGDVGTLLRWDGAAWIRIETGTSRQLLALGASGHTIAVSGPFGVIQRFDLGTATTQELVCGDYWDNDLDGLQNCADPDCAATTVCTNGGLCRGATSVTCGSTTATTRGGPSRFDLFTCADAFTTGSEHYFRFTPVVSGSVTAHFGTATPDFSIAVLRATVNGEPSACNIDDCIGFGPEVTFDATAGETYFLVVDAPDGVGGEFTLDLACP